MDEKSLAIVYIRLQISAKQADVDRVKKSLGDKLNVSVKGLMVNCSETQLNDSAIQMLMALTDIVRNDGKRLALTSLSPQASDAVHRKDEYKSALDLFGENPHRQTSPKKPSNRLHRRWLAIVGTTCAVAIPLILTFGYWIYMVPTPDVVVATKTFEPVSQENFVVCGTVDSIQSGKRKPDVGAIVIAWIKQTGNDPTLVSKTESSRLIQSARVTYVDSRGQFYLPIDAAGSLKHIAIGITVMSEALDATHGKNDASEPALPRPNFYHPTRQTQTYDFVVESGKPVYLNLLFF